MPENNDPPLKVFVVVTDTKKNRQAKIEIGAENITRLVEKVSQRMGALDEYDFFLKTSITR